jgi:hypothetical protein
MKSGVEIGPKVLKRIRNSVWRGRPDSRKTLCLGSGDQRLFESLGGQKSRSE